MKISLGPGASVGFLSAAPRVSTREDAEAAGPRSHVLGILGAFERRGAQVERFIVGDHMPARVSGHSERALHSSRVRALGADVARLALGAINARRAWRHLGGKVDWVYERIATLQSLGGEFRRRGVPWVLETSSPVYYEAKHERGAIVLSEIARRRELEAYRRCDAIVAVSRDLRDILVDAGLPAQKIIVVPNGVDTTRFDPARHAAAPRVFPGFTIGFVGAVIGRQGLDVLLDAIAALRARGIDVNAAIAGDGKQRPELEQRAHALGVAAHIRFLGRLEASAVPPFLASVDVGYSGQTAMQIGKMYHSPLKLYEYLAMARPVLASAFDDARAVVDDGRTGFLFAPGDRRDLERAITSAYARRAHLYDLGAEARRRVVLHHSWDTRVALMMDALAAI